MRLRTIFPQNCNKLHSHQIYIPLTALADYSAKDPRLSKAQNNDTVEKHELLLELPRFALHLKLPKRDHKPEGSHFQAQKECQQKCEKQIKKEIDSYSIEDFQAVHGTPQATTQSMVPKQKLLQDSSVVEQKPLILMDEEAQHIQKPIKSLSKASILLNQLYDGLKTRRTALSLDKVSFLLNY